MRRLGIRAGRRGIGAVAASAAEAPTGAAMTVPATSGATVAVTGIAFTGDCTHMLILAVAHGAAAPEQPVAGAEGWITAAATYNLTPTLVGELDFYLFGKNGASGPVSEVGTPETGWCNPEPWVTAGNIFNYRAPALGGTVTSDASTPPLVSQVSDMQPADSYPTGKTAAFHLTSSGADRFQLVGGAFHCENAASRHATSAAAELLAFLNGSDKPFSVVLTTRSTSSPVSGVYGSGLCVNASAGGNPFATPLMRMILASGSTVLNVQRFDDVAANKGASVSVTGITDWHVYAFRFNGTRVWTYRDDGVLADNADLDVGAFTAAVLEWYIEGGDGLELSGWSRALDEDELLGEITNHANRATAGGFSIPLA